MIARRSRLPVDSADWVDWRDRASCARPGVDPELFFPFPGEHGKAARAKRICAGCPVRPACLADAMASRDGFGIRGGLTPNERQRLRGGTR
jgi:WhiB family transcriptional regulator, redox-sensing transcriptional regulator